MSSLDQRSQDAVEGVAPSKLDLAAVGGREPQARGLERVDHGLELAVPQRHLAVRDLQVGVARAADDERLLEIGAAKNGTTRS